MLNVVIGLFRIVHRSGDDSGACRRGIVIFGIEGGPAVEMGKVLYIPCFWNLRAAGFCERGRGGGGLCYEKKGIVVGRRFRE